MKSRASGIGKPQSGRRRDHHSPFPVPDSPQLTGTSCPVALDAADRVLLGHGSGGRLSHALLRERFLPRFSNDALQRLGDAAVVDVAAGRVAISTDTFVVRPLEFPGGNIGSLAVNGTLNDLAMMGAEPRYLTTGFVLEEGLPFSVLDRVLDGMADAARAAGVPVVAGDTKVVERGLADGMFINTTGVGEVALAFAPAPDQARPGDAVLVSGPIGCHGIAVLAARGELGFDAEVESDTADLGPVVRALKQSVAEAVHVLRDPTRGGLASALNEIAAASAVGVELDEVRLPIPRPVVAACEILGLDALYVANEGILVAFVAAEAAGAALEAMRRTVLGAHATLVGRATPDHAGLVALRTALGTRRVVDLLPGDQLPRIC